MADTIALSLDPARVQVKPQENAAASVLVRNRTEEVGNYALALEGVPPEWGEITPALVSAFPFQDARAQVTLHPPAGVPNALYRLTVVARSQDQPGLEGRALLEVDVFTPEAVQAPPPPPPPPGDRSVAVTPPPQQVAAQIELRVEPSQDKPLPPPAMAWKLRVKNAGNILDTFGFSFAGIPQSWVSIDPVEVQLRPGDEGAALLVVQPAGDARAAVYPFTLRAFSHVNLNERTEVTLRLEVRASAAFQIDLTPREAETQGMRDFQVILTSSPGANSDLTLDLSASDQDGACDYAFNPKTLVLPARQRAASNLRVRPRAVLNPNERKQYTFKVEAVPQQALAPRQAVEGRLTQVAAAPVSLALQPQVQSSEQEGDYVLKITNPSGVDINLFFNAEDPEAACDYTFLPDRRFVPANGTSSCRLHVKARAAHYGQASKQILFTVKATRQGDLLSCASVQGGLNQVPTKPITLELIPPQQSQPGSAKYSLRVNNPYAAPIQVWLEARDENDALEFKFSKQSLQVSPGADGLVEMHARPKDKLQPGDQRRVHKFTVTGLVQGANVPSTTAGTLAQTQTYDWAGPLGKVFGFFGSILKLIWKLIRWLIPWIIVLVVLYFLFNLGISGLHYLVLHDSQIGSIITGVIPRSLIFNWHDTMWFRGISDKIVDAVAQILGVVRERSTPTPTPPPPPTPTP